MSEILNPQGLVLRKLATIVALDLCLEHVETIATEYRSDYIKNFDKHIRTTARYKTNKCKNVLVSSNTLRNELIKELKPTAGGVEVIDNTVAHYTDLFFEIISMEPNHQDRVKGLIKSLRKLS